MLRGHELYQLYVGLGDGDNRYVIQCPECDKTLVKQRGEESAAELRLLRIEHILDLVIRGRA